MSTKTDDFNRANGGLGTDWTTITGGTGGQAPQIASNKATSPAALTGALRSAETYDNDQSSSVEVQGALGATHWVGVIVRGNLAGTPGDNCYLAIYFNNNPDYRAQIYKRASGGFTLLKDDALAGAASAGDVFKLAVVGTTLTFTQNGVVRSTITDATFASGAPGIMFAGAGETVDNWSGEGAPAVTDPGVEGEFRLLEDGSFRELEDASGRRLLEQSVGGGDEATSTGTGNTRRRAAAVLAMQRRRRRRR